jgi:hypothetical protein
MEPPIATVADGTAAAAADATSVYSASIADKALGVRGAHPNNVGASARVELDGRLPTRTMFHR